MNAIRSIFDIFYDTIKPIVFVATEKDPQKAHELFTFFCKFLHASHLEKLVLDNGYNNNFRFHFEISNAAGFNKNADIPPTVLKYLGFDRIVFGTITHDQWDGNHPRPTIRRYVETESMVNWMGLPGDGAPAIAERISHYGDHKVPITINFMSTPKKQGDELLKDLEGTILKTRDLPYVDRFELNISCPNTHNGDGRIDARKENLGMLDSMREIVDTNVYAHQEIYLKVSPDSTYIDVDDTADIAKNHRIKGVVTANTTTKHNRRYIRVSPKIDGKQVGGASGNAVYEDSLSVQRMYDDKIKEVGLDWNIIACGGINSLERAYERLRNGAIGIQIYTPLIFSGTKLLRKLRDFNYI